jgi:hypothetical protein
MTYLSKMKLDDASQRAYFALFWYSIVQLMNVLYAADDELSLALISHTTTTSYAIYVLSYLLPLIAFLIARFSDSSKGRFSLGYKYGGSFFAVIYTFFNAFEAYWSVNSAAFNAVPTLLPSFLAIIFNGVIAKRPDIAKLIFFASDEASKEKASAKLADVPNNKDQMKKFARAILTELYDVTAADKVATIKKFTTNPKHVLLDPELKGLLKIIYSRLQPTEKIKITEENLKYFYSAPANDITFDPNDIPAAFELIRTMLPNLDPYVENNPTYTELKTKVVAPIQDIIYLVVNHNENAPIAITEDAFEKVLSCMPQIMKALAESTRSTWFQDSAPNSRTDYLPLFVYPKATITDKYKAFLSSYIESLLAKDNPDRVAGFVANTEGKKKFAELYTEYNRLIKDIPAVKLKDLNGPKINELKTVITEFIAVVNANLTELAKKELINLTEGFLPSDLDNSSLRTLTMEYIDGTKVSPFQQGLDAYMTKFNPMQLHINKLADNTQPLLDRIQNIIAACKEQSPTEPLQKAIAAEKALLITDLTKVASITPKFDQGAKSEDAKILAEYKKIKVLITPNAPGAALFGAQVQFVDTGIKRLTTTSDTYQMLKMAKDFETLDPASLDEYIQTYDNATKLYKPGGKISPDAPPDYDKILSNAADKINAELDNLAAVWPVCDSNGNLTDESTTKKILLTVLSPILVDNYVGAHFKGKKAFIDQALARYTDQPTLEASKAAAILFDELKPLPDCLKQFSHVKAASKDILPTSLTLLQEATPQIAAKLKELEEANPKFTDDDATMKNTIEEVIAAITEDDFETQQKALTARIHLFDTASEHYIFAKNLSDVLSLLTAASKNPSYSGLVNAMKLASDALSGNPPAKFDETEFNKIVNQLQLYQANAAAFTGLSTLIKATEKPENSKTAKEVIALFNKVSNLKKKEIYTLGNEDRVFNHDSQEFKHLNNLLIQYFAGFNKLDLDTATVDPAGLKTVLDKVPDSFTVIELAKLPQTKATADKIVTIYEAIVNEALDGLKFFYEKKFDTITQAEYETLYTDFWTKWSPCTNFSKFNGSGLIRHDQKKQTDPNAFKPPGNA